MSCSLCFVVEGLVLSTTARIEAPDTRALPHAIHEGEPRCHEPGFAEQARIPASRLACHRITPAHAVVQATFDIRANAHGSSFGVEKAADYIKWVSHCQEWAFPNAARPLGSRAHTTLRAPLLLKTSNKSSVTMRTARRFSVSHGGIPPNENRAATARFSCSGVDQLPAAELDDGAGVAEK